MKQLFTLVLTLFISFNCFAQANLNRCGTFNAIQFREQQQPGYLARTQACFENAKQIADANKANRSGSDTVYRVQMVFHVVYNSALENIPDSVIYSQLEVLNEDYRRLNADTARTRSEFLPVAGDPHIEFVLATTDPDGNTTTGITRTPGSGSFIGYSPFADDVKKEPGGKAPWPTDRYVNVWVCNIFFGIVLGYSYPPSNAPNWDSLSLSTDSALQGVALHYAAVGRNFSQPIDQTVAGGRTLTHELGHYFGLRHIWGDSTGCNNDDGINDTPYASDASQQTCDTVINSCPDAPTDFHDMIENYMDYSDDRCVNMFTKEQIGLIHAMLQTSRAGVATVVTGTGIKNAENNFETIQLFPNPSTGTIYLNAQVKNGKNYSYEIYNAIGEKLTGENNLTSSSNHRSIYLSAQPSGIYFAKITCDEQVVVKKFQLVR